MTDPIRWSEASDPATHAASRLVRCGQDLLMPSDEKQAVWSQIASSMPTAALTVPAKASSGSLGSLLTLKSLCLLLAAAGLVAGGYGWLTKASPAAESAPQVAASVAPLTKASANAVSTAETRSSATPEVSSVSTAIAQVPAASHVSQLREESLAVMVARQALRANNATKALQLLEQAQLRFKKGVLREEREALTIEALTKSGQSARAAARAEAFLRNYPRSPHAADVQPFVTK